MLIGGTMFSTTGNERIEHLRKVLRPIPATHWSGLTTEELSTITTFLTNPYVQLYDRIKEVERIMNKTGIPIPA